MRTAYLVRTALGVLLLNEEMKLKAVFHEHEEKLSPEIIEKMKQFDRVVVEEEELMSKLQELNVVLEQPSHGGRWVRANFKKISNYLTISNPEQVLRSKAIEESAKSVTKASSSLEQELICAVSAYDTITKSINELSEKLLDWNDLYFPELRRSLKPVEKAIQILRDYPSRDMIISAGSKLPMDLVEEAKRSSYPLPPETTVNLISQFASSISQLISLRESISRRIGEVMKNESPNLTAVAGQMLGAKLISKAGGMMNLAKLPASSIQIIGAERALFRSMREGTKPPKHGIIFQHPLVHGAPRKFRGKAARMVASSISIAAKFDAFSGIDRGQELNDSMRRKMDNLLKRRVDR